MKLAGFSGGGGRLTRWAETFGFDTMTEAQKTEGVRTLPEVFVTSVDRVQDRYVKWGWGFVNLLKNSYELYIADGRQILDGNGVVHRYRVYIAEEQEILREAFQSFFLSHPRFEVVGASEQTTGDALIHATLSLRPDVVLLGVRGLEPEVTERLEFLKERCPDVAVAVLSAYYDIAGIKALRRFIRDAQGGCAYLMKHTVDTVDQLTHVVESVAEGRVILDPAVMQELLTAGDSSATVLRELSPREREVLNWMAQGYRNNTIAEIMCLELKTVERHINSIYSKLGGPATEAKHMRVHSITLYLKATGQLPSLSLGGA